MKTMLAMPRPRSALRAGTRWWPALVLASVAASALMLAGCKDRKSVAPAKVVASGAPAPKSVLPVTAERGMTDKWLGRWTGTEGRWLNIELLDNGKYLITIQSSDNLSTYEGLPAGHRIRFQRGGQADSLRLGESGKDFHVAGLEGRSRCLYASASEAYCQ